MKIYNIISQTELNEVQGNDIDQQPSKIKEKEESLRNTLVKRFNVPTKQIQKVEVKENKSESNIKPYRIIDRNNEQLTVGNSKLINVKEKMLENIKSKAPLEKVDVKPVEIPVEETKVPEPVVETVSEIKNEEKEIEPAKVEPVIERDNTDDVLELRKEVDTIKQELEKSTRDLQEMDIKYNESEKNKRQAEERSRELDKEIKEFLKSQSYKYKNEIESNVRSIEQNKNKIRELQTKIDNNIQETVAINEKNAKKENYLNYLKSQENSSAADFNLDDNQKENVFIKKVA